MKLDLSNLNWNNANVFEFKYIYYLALMLHERSNKIGINTYNTGVNFDINDYEPGGFFRFKQLYSIYCWTLFLGKYAYFKPDTLNNDSFRFGRRVKHFGYSLKDMSEIAQFDFTKHLLIPGQRLDYYNKFLKPLYLILKEFKKIWYNRFISIDTAKLYHGYSLSDPPKVTKYNIEQDQVGQDVLDYYTLDQCKQRELEISPSAQSYSPAHATTFLGGRMVCSYHKFTSFGYTYSYTDQGITYTRPESWYASNFEGKKFLFYSILPSGQIQCPAPLNTGVNYQLYMYSFNLLDVSIYVNSPRSIINRFYYNNGNTPETNVAYKYIDYMNPGIVLKPFGNYYLMSEGTINNEFETFNISLPEKFPYNESIFDNYPIEMFGAARETVSINRQEYRCASYNGNPDPDLWTEYGSTPSQDERGNPLQPGKYYSWIGPKAGRWSYNPELNGLSIEWWYKPLLIVDNSSLFQYN